MGGKGWISVPQLNLQFFGLSDHSSQLFVQRKLSYLADSLSVYTP